MAARTVDATVRITVGEAVVELPAVISYTRSPYRSGDATRPPEYADVSIDDVCVKVGDQWRSSPVLLDVLDTDVLRNWLLHD